MQCKHCGSLCEGFTGSGWCPKCGAMFQVWVNYFKGTRLGIFKGKMTGVYWTPPNMEIVKND